MVTLAQQPPSVGRQVPPGPGSLIRTLGSALRDPLGFLVRVHREYGDFVELRKGVTFLIANPDGIKRVLQDNHLNYQKGSRYRRALGRLMGDGLLTAEGEAWKRQRHLAQPAFLRSQHQHFAETIVRHTSELVEQCRQAALDGTAIDLHHAIARCSLTIMLDLMFSDDLQDRSESLAVAFLQAEQSLNVVRVFLPVEVPSWLPTPSNIRFDRALAVLDVFIADVIAHRRASGVARDDLLAAYLNARDEEQGTGLDDRLLRDEMVTLLSAGHETVSDSLAWTFVELMKHPECYDRVCAEADAASSKSSGLEAAAAVPYTTMAFQEGLRMYPPGWGFLRTAIKEDEILGYHIPAGTRLVLSPYLMHRDARLWNEPERFDPERFTPERSAGRHRFAWFPFSAGPRMCIGAGMAMLEAQLLIAMLSRIVRFELVEGQTIHPLPRVSLKPSGPVMVRARLRSES
jgi:cytochrome P450